VTQTLGKYTLVKKLATGGMAEVFLARIDGPKGFAKRCVVKRILPHFTDDPRFTDMFLSEARLAAELNHPNLVQIFDFGEADGQYYLAMEYIDGPNLRALNQAARERAGPMPFQIAARLIAQAAEGLHYAHELRGENGEFLNLVHRDISPDNILVSRSGAVKVVDFGIAKASSQPHLTKSGMIKGKLAYMPPEQLARDPLDRRADLFALGIVLYELITGNMPFDATSEVSIIQAIMSLVPLERPTRYRGDCPPQLDAIVHKCLQKDREARYASCRELQGDLEAFIAASGVAVGTRDVADFIASVMPPEDEAPQVVLTPANPLDATTPSTRSRERAMATPATPAATTGTGLSNTALRPVATPVAESSAPTRSRAPLAVAAALVAAVAAIAGWLFTRPAPAVVATPTPAPLPPAVAEFIDAGSATGHEPADAGLALAEAPDAGNEVPDDTPPTPKPLAAKTGRLELRIRPYATVYLDDRRLGDTPLPAQVVPVGKHKLRLVNEKLGKEVTLDVTVGAGTTIVKHNLKE
jgi:serine/threonine-protein kinase